MAEKNYLGVTKTQGGTILGRPSDDDYMKQIEQYRDSEYYDALLNNPWLFSKNAEFTPSTWNQIQEGVFNDFSARHNYYANLQNMQNQYLAEQVSAMRQEQHDSPAAEVARRRLAGLNDDLSGGSAIGTGQAAENDQPMIPGQLNVDQQNPLDAVQQVGSLFMQAMTFGQSFVSGFQSLGMNEIQMANALQPIVKDFVSNSFGAPKLNPDTGKWDFPDITGAAEIYARDNFRSAHARKAFLRQVGQNQFSAKGAMERFTTSKGFSDARYSVGQSLGRDEAYGYDGRSTYSVDVFVDVARELHGLYKDVVQFEAEYEHGYKGALRDKGKDFAETEIEANKVKRQELSAYEKQKRIDEITNSAVERILSILEGRSRRDDLGGWISAGTLMAFSAMRLNMLPSLNLPNINIDRSEKTFVKSLMPNQ